MPLSIADRVIRIRQGIAEAQSDPCDLFGARMTVHEAFGSMGVDTNYISKLLLPDRAPIESKHLDMLDQVAHMFDCNPVEAERNPMGFCETVRMMLG